MLPEIVELRMIRFAPESEIAPPALAPGLPAVSYNPEIVTLVAGVALR